MSSTDTPGPRAWTLLAGIVALGLALRLACAILLASPLVSDYLAYWDLATGLHNGLGLVGPDGRPTAFMSPGYPIFVAAVFDLLGHGVGAVKASNLALSAASMVLLFLATRRLFGSTAVAAVATLLFAAYAEAIVYTAYVAKENLMIPLMILQLWIVADREPERRAWINPVLFGLATGLVAMVGNAALSLMPAMIVLLFLRNPRPLRAVRTLAIAALVAGATLTPLLLRNHAAFGAFVLNNNGGFNLYIGNNPRATPLFTSIADTPLGPRWHALHAELGEHGADMLLRRTALDYMRENPGTTASLMLRKAAVFWLPPTHAGQGQEGRADRAVRLVWLIQFVALCGLFLLSAAWLGRRWRSLGPLWLTILGYTAIHMIFYVVYRYRLPIMPFICMGAAFTAAALIPTLSGAREKQARPPGASKADEVTP